MDGDDENGRWWQEVDGPLHCDVTGSSNKSVEDDDCMHTGAVANDTHDSSTVTYNNIDQQQNDDERARDGILRRRTRTHAAWTELARDEMIKAFAESGHSR